MRTRQTLLLFGPSNVADFARQSCFISHTLNLGVQPSSFLDFLLIFSLGLQNIKWDIFITLK